MSGGQRSLSLKTVGAIAAFVGLTLSSGASSISSPKSARARESSPQLAGHWIGHWYRDGDSLSVWFGFTPTDPGWAGTFGSDDLRAANIPLRAVRSSATGVHFELVGDVTTTVFDGRRKGRVLTGTFVEGKRQGEFRLTRSRALSQAFYSEEEVRFSNGDVVLAGTPLIPKGRRQHPALLFMHGSGPEGRAANRYLADRFARAGVAALIYDKRGVRGSTGDWRHSSFKDLAGDALEGLKLLKRDSRIRPNAIGIYGHSQGGTITPLVAERSADVAFVIASAASGVSPTDAERFSLLNAVGASRLAAVDSVRAATYVDLVVKAAYEGGDWSRADSAAKADSAESWYFPLPPADHHYWAFSRAIAGYDPIAHWSHVHVPVLLLYGERDQRVPVASSRANIEAVLARAGNRDVTTRVFAGADHTFRTTAEGTSHWPRTVPDYMSTMLSWVRKRTEVD